MKKFTFAPIVVGVLLMVACGPSQQEIEAREQAIQDSLRQDSTMKAEEAAMQQAIQDSIANAELLRQQFVADSLKQDSIANATKGKKKK